jgi:septal ring factor EnvC (AmiA/AmiB activator)
VVVAQLRTEVHEQNKKIAAQQRELTKTKERLARARADQSLTNHKLTKLQQQPAVELKFESTDGSFSIKDMHPDAAAAWRRFAHEIIAQNDGVMTPNDPGRVLTMPVGGHA